MCIRKAYNQVSIEGMWACLDPVLLWIVWWFLFSPLSWTGNGCLFRHLGIVMIPSFLNFFLKDTITFSRFWSYVTLAFYREIFVTHTTVAFWITFFLYMLLNPVPLLETVTLIILKSDVGYSFSCEWINTQRLFKLLEEY